MSPSDETLTQIAHDAHISPKQFIRFVRVFGLSIMQAVTACRTVRHEKRKAKRAKVKPVKGKAKSKRRQQAANDYVQNAWRFDVR